MANNTTIYEKPLPHMGWVPFYFIKPGKRNVPEVKTDPFPGDCKHHFYGLREWYAKQWEIQENAAKGRVDAFGLRSSGKIIRSEARVKTEWDTYMNNARITDRITELSKWRETLEGLSNRLTYEMKLLEDEKTETEREIEFLHCPLEVTMECLSMRDCRRGTELTYDEADTELKKELRVTEQIKSLLTDRAQATWEKINRLKEVKFQVDLDLENKLEAVKIDAENLNLDETCANMSYKPNALRVPHGLISYERWLEHTHYTKALADNELSDTYNFREAMSVMRQRAKNDITTQQDASDFTLRKRIYQTQKAKSELEWQKYKMTREMDVLQKEITSLNNSLLDKVNKIKCAETRLENRTYRPGVELCRDEVDVGLRNEIEQLRQTEADLQNVLENTRTSYNSSESMLASLNKNLDDKQHSLTTDIACLDMRKVLQTGERAPPATETDRNIVLARLENDIPADA